MRPKTAHYLASQRAFTLIEILIAILILGIVLSTVYAAYSGTMNTAHILDAEGKAYKMARVAISRMAHDLSAVTPVGGAFEFRAEKEALNNREFHSIYFWSAGHLAFGANEVNGSPSLIGYYVEENEKEGSFSLYRSDVLSGNTPREKNSGGYLICKNINALRLLFYDEKGKEYDYWDSAAAQQEGKAPAVIQIELSLLNADNKDKPFQFMTKVFITAKP